MKPEYGNRSGVQKTVWRLAPFMQASERGQEDRGWGRYSIWRVGCLVSSRSLGPVVPEFPVEKLRASIVVPVHNGSSTISRCLSTLSTLGDGFEVIVVDDASTDESADIARQWGARVIQCSRNVGPGPARNAGAFAANGEVVVFIDADIYAPSASVVALVDELLSNQQLDALFGSYDSEPYERDNVSQYRNLLHHYVHQKAPRISSHFWSGFGAIRAERFRQVHGFSDGYYGRCSEDIDLGYRMRAENMKIGVAPYLQVKHLKKWTIRSMIRVDFHLRGIAWTKLLLQNRHFPADFSLSHIHTVSSVLALTLILLIPVTISYPYLGLLELAIALAFIIVNRRFFGFISTIRSTRFAIFCIPLHFLYHLNAMAAFIAGTLLYLFETLTPEYRIRVE